MSQTVPPVDTLSPTASDHDGHAPHGYIGQKEDYLKRLRRIEGQARGLQRMVEEEKYCIDILTQVSAMTSALRSVALGLLDEHLQHCVVAGRRGGRRRGRGQAAGGLAGHRPTRPVLTDRTPSQHPNPGSRSP